VKTVDPKKKPRKIKKRRFKKRQVEVIQNPTSKNYVVKDAIDNLDHSYKVDVQRESFWSKVANFFRVKLRNEQRTRTDRFFYKLKNWWPLSRLSGRIFLIYVAVVLLGTLLLSVPGVVIDNQFKWDFLTALFTTSSAFSDTGLAIANTSADYSFWGQLIIVLLIELGGIGVMTIKIVVYLALNRKISINDTNLAQIERGNDNLNSAIVLIRDGFLVLTSIQLVAMSLLFFVFYFAMPGTQGDALVWDEVSQTMQHTNLETVSPYHNFSKSLWYAIFHSTSAINNAGFDLVSANSLQPYNVQGHYSHLLQVIFLLEWVLGGLGYPTFHDIKRKFKARRTGETVRFSLYTKLNFIIYFILFIVGPLAIFGSEMNDRSNSLIFNYYSIDQFGNAIDLTPKPGENVAMDIIFNASSTRNAGFSSVNINNFNGGSKAIMGALMFIGSAPSSTAGGIRTTTLAVIMLATLSVIRNRDHVIAFKRRIPDRVVKRAFAVFFMSALILTIAIVAAYVDSSGAIVSDRNGDSSIVELFLLFASAFGTVGLNPFSPEKTLALGVLTKVLLILIMFLGQLGISNTLLIFVKSGAKRHYDYLEEEVVIG